MKAFGLLFLLILLIPMKSHATNGNSDQLAFVIAQSVPYAFYDVDNNQAGIVVEMAKLLREQTGIKLDIYFAPPLRVYKELANGNAELSVLPVGNRANQVAVPIAKMSESAIVFATLQDNPIRVESLEGLTGKRVAYVKGIPYGPVFKSADNLIKIPALSTEIAIEMLLKRRVELVVSSERTLAYHLITKNIQDKVVFAFELDRKSAYLYVSKASPRKDELTRIFSRTIADLHSKKRIQAIYSHLKLTSDFKSKPQSSLTK